MAVNIVIDYLAGFSLVEWVLFGFISANALIAGVCLVERGILHSTARIKD